MTSPLLNAGPRAAVLQYEISLRARDPALQKLAALQESCAADGAFTRCVTDYCHSRGLVPTKDAHTLFAAGKEIVAYQALTSGSPMKTLAFVDLNASRLCKKDDKRKKNDKDPPDDGPLLGRQKAPLPKPAGKDIMEVRGWGPRAVALMTAGGFFAFCFWKMGICRPQPVHALFPVETVGGELTSTDDPRIR